MGFFKVGNAWIAAGAVVGGAHDHGVDPSGANQEEEPTTWPMDLIPYNPPEDTTSCEMVEKPRRGGWIG